jgi:hypothetical protein
VPTAENIAEEFTEKRPDRSGLMLWELLVNTADMFKALRTQRPMLWSCLGVEYVAGVA